MSVFVLFLFLLLFLFFFLCSRSSSCSCSCVRVRVLLRVFLFFFFLFFLFLFFFSPARSCHLTGPVISHAALFLHITVTEPAPSTRYVFLVRSCSITITRKYALGRKILIILCVTEECSTEEGFRSPRKLSGMMSGSQCR